MLKCHGKCYLSKQLKQVNPAENTNGENQESASLRIKTDPFIITSLQLSKWPEAILAAPFVPFSQHYHSGNHAADIFRPPCGMPA